jgi:hypothetical protein
MILIALGRFSSAQILTAGVPSGFRNGQLMDDEQSGTYAATQLQGSCLAEAGPKSRSAKFESPMALTV